MLTFAAATKTTSTFPTRAPAQRRVDNFVAITCSYPSDSCDLYSDDCRSHAQLVSPSRDPIRYVDGMSMYADYFSPVMTDPHGTDILTPISNEWRRYKDCQRARDLLILQTELPKICPGWTLDIQCLPPNTKKRVCRGNVNGKTSCNKGKKILISICASDSPESSLTTIAHEYQHALDHCKCGSCEKESQDAGESIAEFCEEGWCMEIRGILASGECGGLSTREEREQCVLVRLAPYVRDFGRCSDSSLQNAIKACVTDPPGTPPGLPEILPDFPL